MKRKRKYTPHWQKALEEVQRATTCLVTQALNLLRAQIERQEENIALVRDEFDKLEHRTNGLLVEHDKKIIVLQERAAFYDDHPEADVKRQRRALAEGSPGIALYND